MISAPPTSPAGGHGAPLVPVYHRALAQSLEREGPIVVVNIGGVANITYIDGTDTLMAVTPGPETHCSTTICSACLTSALTPKAALQPRAG